jgi:hypothetical protein
MLLIIITNKKSLLIYKYFHTETDKYLFLQIYKDDEVIYMCGKKIVLPGLLAGAAMLVLSVGISFLFNTVFPGLKAEYVNPALFRPWSDPLMSLYFVYPFVLGLILAWFWSRIKSTIKEKSAMKRGFRFGIGYWIIASVPGMFITYSSFPVSLLMVLSWSAAGFLEVWCAGAIFAKMSK